MFARKPGGCKWVCSNQGPAKRVTRFTAKQRVVKSNDDNDAAPTVVTVSNRVEEYEAEPQAQPVTSTSVRPSSSSIPTGESVRARGDQEPVRNVRTIAELTEENSESSTRRETQGYLRAPEGTR